MPDLVTAADIAVRARQSLQQSLPLLCVRCGDGENIMLGSDLAQQKFIMRRQLGKELPTTQQQQIIASLRATYAAADIIGIPGKSHVRYGKAWAGVVDKLSKHVLPTCQYASVDFHSQLLETGETDRLLRGVTKLFYVAGYDFDAQFKTSYPNLQSITGHRVPAEKKFAHLADNREHYPTVFDRVVAAIAGCDLAGTLCLIGAGVVGKVYGLHCYRRGGIVLDMGSVFDLWAGKVTRGASRNRNLFDDHWKLGKEHG